MVRNRMLATVCGILGLAMASPLSAQDEALTREISVIFDAEVTETAVQTLQIDGYNGPVDYPIELGDRIRFTSTVTVPTAAFFESEFGNGALDEEGQFRFDARFDPTVFPTSPASAIGQVTNFDVSSPLTYTDTFGQAPFVNYGIIYDVNTDTYAIDAGDDFFTGAFLAPGFFYDPDTNGLISCSADCGGSLGNDPPEFRVLGDPAVGVLRTTGIRVYEVPEDQRAGSAIAGFFNLVFGGSWNLPVSGGATPVPAPGMLLLFGASGFVILRRKSHRKSGAGSRTA